MITSNSEYDILGTVPPHHKDLIRIWIIWIQKVPVSHFTGPLNIIVFQNVLILSFHLCMNILLVKVFNKIIFVISILLKCLLIISPNEVFGDIMVLASPPPRPRPRRPDNLRALEQLCSQPNDTRIPLSYQMQYLHK